MLLKKWYSISFMKGYSVKDGGYLTLNLIQTQVLKIITTNRLSAINQCLGQTILHFL